MKLVVAIVHSEDSGKLNTVLNQHGYSVTKLATTGGFLHAGNTTLLIGTEDDKVSEVMQIVQAECRTRKQITATSAPMGGIMPCPIEVEVGGATVFVLDVEQFEKL